MPNSAKSNWDVRQITLYHAQMSGDHFFGEDVLPNSESMYIALGHHNSFVVTPIELSENGEHPFETILNSSIDVHKRVNGKGSTMVIVAISNLLMPATNSLDEEKKPSLGSFWAEDSPLLFCTLLHLPLNHSPLNDIMRDLSKWIQSLNDVLACCYWTIDCCDLVLFIKANTFQAGTKAIFDLSNNQLPDTKSVFLPISYAYTVWGVQHKIVFSDAVCPWQESLEHVQIRATVQSIPSFLHTAVSLLEGKGIDSSQYILQGLLGDQDICIHFYKIESCQLIAILRILIVSLKNYDTLMSLHTQIGTFALPPKEQPHRSQQSVMYTAASNLLSHMKALDESIAKEDTWETPVYELLNKLVQMSDSGVYDDIFFQLYLPAQLFIEQVAKFIEFSKIRGIPMNCMTESVESLHKFVRGWHSVMHLSMRADAQLVQAPGRLPILYELPAKLCEFYAAFAHIIAAYYQSSQPQKYRRDRSFLIVPRLISRVATEAVFNFDFPPEKRLVFCDMPTSMVFHISQTMVILAHEVAHFTCGPTCLRPLRLNKFAQCAASLICKHIGFIDYFGFNEDQKARLIINIAGILEKSCKEYIRKLHNELNTPFSKEELNEYGYQNEQYNAIGSSITKLLTRPYTKLSEAITSIHQNPESETILPGVQSCVDLYLSKDPSNDILIQRLYCFRELLFESFADCAAIHTLNLQQDEFFSAICYANPLETIDDVTRAIAKPSFCIRMMAANHFFFSDKNAPRNPNGVLELLIAKSKSIYPDDSDESIIFQHLCEYLRACLDEMRRISVDPSIHDQFENLQMIFNDIARFPSINEMQSRFNSVLFDYWDLVSKRASVFSKENHEQGQKSAV